MPVVDEAQTDQVRVILADIGWSAMMRALAAAAGNGELRDLLNTVAVALDKGELRAIAPPIQTARLHRPA